MNIENIAIAGAGSIGCFVGGLLLSSGKNVSFLGRSRISKQLKKYGFVLTSFSGMRSEVVPAAINISKNPDVLRSADLILVCVKSGATEQMAGTIRKNAKPGAIVVSLQNGVRNAETLRNSLPGYDVRAGLVEFNVVSLGDGRFHQGTSGNIVIEAGSPDLSDAIRANGLVVKSATDIQSVQWGKLLVNLNNALNALSGIPLVEELSDRNWRTLLADQMSEALAVMKAEGIVPIPPSPVPASFIPKILRLPTPVFKLVAKQMLSMDPQARSSMWEDLQNGRKTEIDELQGEIVALGEKHKLPTPANQNILQQIKQLEAQQ